MLFLKLINYNKEDCMGKSKEKNYIEYIKYLF